jgi:hypothetical protein
MIAKNINSITAQTTVKYISSIIYSSEGYAVMSTLQLFFLPMPYTTDSPRFKLMLSIT